MPSRLVDSSVEVSDTDSSRRGIPEGFWLWRWHATRRGSLGRGPRIRTRKPGETECPRHRNRTRGSRREHRDVFGGRGVIEIKLSHFAADQGGRERATRSVESGEDSVTQPDAATPARGDGITSLDDICTRYSRLRQAIDGHNKAVLFS